MREVVELATQKALRAYIETAERAGLTLIPTDGQEGVPTDDERYEEERGRAWS
jgi:hypothetical protein